MHEWFRYLFTTRMNVFGYVYCGECGKPLSKDKYMDNSCIYSHLIEKSKYPMFAGNQDNILIVCPDCHNLYTMSPKLAKTQYKLAQEFKIKHLINNE